MRENNTSAWPFAEITDSEGLDIESIFGKPSEGANQENPFEVPAAAPAVSCSPDPVSAPVTAPAEEAIVNNPIAAAFEQKTAENTKTGLLEKPPVFYHKGVTGSEQTAYYFFRSALTIC